jgi:hypothetical protein
LEEKKNSYNQKHRVEVERLHHESLVKASFLQSLDEENLIGSINPILLQETYDKISIRLTKGMNEVVCAM